MACRGIGWRRFSFWPTDAAGLAREAFELLLQFGGTTTKAFP